MFVVNLLLALGLLTWLGLGLWNLWIIREEALRDV